MRVDEYNSHSSQLQRYREALRTLEERGVRIADGCRLRTYEKRLNQLICDPRPAVEVELVYAASFDLREIDEITEIIKYLPPALDSTVLDLLRKLGSGSDHPDDETSAPAREAQYELYLGAVFRRAGIPTRHGVPDLIAHWRNQDYFVEAKRPASPKKLDDRLRSAIHQARKLPRPGIIAICADQLIRPKNTLMTVKTFNDLSPAVDELLTEFKLRNTQVLRGRLASEQSVAAILWTARIPARISVTGHSSLGTAIQLDQVTMVRTPEIDFAASTIEAYQKAQGKQVP